MKRILIFCQHFAPAYKGGGPIQSLINLVALLESDFEIRIVCAAKDMGDVRSMTGIRTGLWNVYSNNTEVLYIEDLTFKIVRSILQSKPDFVYVNGIFSLRYNLIPIILKPGKDSTLIVSPRGMLQAGALAVKPFKKKIFLSLFKFFGLHKDIRWHATDEQEWKDVKEIFSSAATVAIASNIPRRLVELKTRAKIPGQLRLVFLSLITEKKNLHVALEALKLIEQPITFHIYGPVKDLKYWERCQDLMREQKHSIEYRGSIPSHEVQDRLSEYDSLILPSKGENFGHAIFESLSVGTPPIISKYTPWGLLQEMNAGITVESDKADEWANAVSRLIDLSSKQFCELSAGAHRLASKYFSENEFKEQYDSLFR